MYWSSIRCGSFKCAAAMLYAYMSAWMSPGTALNTGYMNLTQSGISRRRSLACIIIGGPTE